MSWTWMEIPLEWRVSHMMLALSVPGPPTAAAPCRGLCHLLLLWPRHAVDVGGHLGALDTLRGATSTMGVGRSDLCTL